MAVFQALQKDASAVDNLSLSPSMTLSSSRLWSHKTRFPIANLACVCIFLSVVPAFASVDFPQCFADIKEGKHGTTGGTDNQGNPVADITKATSITYEFCQQACGTGGGAFSWSSFSQQFSAWLLPWLALLSQFPFGSKYKEDNLMSVILSLGSPCLAAYSLSLTVLNTKWVARRFANVKYPNSRDAALILSTLQHTPVKVTTGRGLLASLVVLPENDAWWKELGDRLDYADTHTWTIAGATSVAWVAVAYALTIIDAFSTISTDPNSNGQGLSGVGSIWLWMLPLTIAYLQISPRCDAVRVAKALDDTNDISFTACDNGAVVNVNTVNKMRALSMHPDRGSLYHDQDATAPIFHYARLFSFTQVVEEFMSVFHCASENAKEHFAVDRTIPWRMGDGRTIHPANRRGTREQVMAYCHPSIHGDPVRTYPPGRVPPSHWGPDVFSRLLIASVAALALQWSTSGASILIVYFTPTVGESSAYLLYAAVATLIWAIMVTSSVITHYAAIYTENVGLSQRRERRTAARVAVLLRWLAKCLAACNAAWIITAFLLQFGNFYDRCYCNSDVLGLGKRAHNVMQLLGSDISAMKAAWVGGVVLAVVGSSLFLGFINVFIDPW
ncbi:hypothetical protein MVEN_00384500 [Mycena venus]|uniref:Uncharacterized protein n=1 Tax=Mycena venus TaxID=2733690 RepID=A0A8H6YTW9_9AGAR|nr:hypothetical protein MVEN_00384500 [Mycena venus]